MIIKFLTQIDIYRGHFSSIDLPMPPRQGESIEVSKSARSLILSKNLPTSLHVQSIAYKQGDFGTLYAEVELHYSGLQLQVLGSNNINPFP